MAYRLAIGNLRNQRFGPGRKDYFWINDMHPRMVMHPYRHDLEGRDTSNSHSDGCGLIGIALILFFCDAFEKPRKISTQNGIKNCRLLFYRFAGSNQSEQK
ncbi:MAG: hypothetical protein GY874_11070 [Desulfobacteraceae bacterium]|nr:hypothetical protein [Desulfobacteraceae bacterium]